MSAKNCVTHSHACDCREAIFKEKEQRLDCALQLLRELDAEFDGNWLYEKWYDQVKEILKEQGDNLTSPSGNKETT
jgi:hypothetical protein